MKDPLRNDLFAAIGDPFAREMERPARSLDPPRVPRGTDRSPTRSRVLAVRRTAFASAILYDAAYVLLVERRPDLSTVSSVELFVGLAIPLAAALAALAAASRGGRRGLGLSVTWVAAIVAIGPAFFTTATLAVAPTASADPLFWRHVAGCAAVTSILTLGPLALGLRAYRRAFISAARLRGAALGIAAGALASAAMSIACPIESGWHVILGHGAVMLVAGLTAACLAPAILRG